MLVLTGEAGIGKTSLLDFAAAEAGTMAVVRLGGTEAESQTPYAALQLVLAAMGTTTELLPAAQTQALEVAFATRTGPLPNPFAVGAATLATLSQRADRGPVLLIVDDGHLVDHASATALAFATRRLVADSIAVVVAVRTGMPSPFASAGLPTLPVSGLDEPAVAELLRRLTRGRGARPRPPRPGPDRGQPARVDRAVPAPRSAGPARARRAAAAARGTR
ncbi:MAG: ATP-binding protein [Dermatophilaceae bacterium]